MRESVIYQDILQQGRQEGRQEGQREEACTLILRQLSRRVGPIPDTFVAQINHHIPRAIGILGGSSVGFQCHIMTWIGGCGHYLN